MAHQFKGKHSVYPISSQAWSTLWSAPPKGFEITTCKEQGKEDALLMGGNCLSNSAFKKRWRNWTKLEAVNKSV